MYDVTKLVPEKILTELLYLLPTPRQKRRGRKRVKKEALLNGILQVLCTGVGWRKIAECGCSYSSCYRYFKELQRRGELKFICQVLARSKTDLREGAIDTTTSTSFRFTHLTGWDGKHKKMGTKISLFTDPSGLPADVDFEKGNTHDLHFVSDHLKRTAGKPKVVLSLDKGYTSLELRRELRKKGGENDGFRYERLGGFSNVIDNHRLYTLFGIHKTDRITSNNFPCRSLLAELLGIHGHDWLLVHNDCLL